MSASRTTQPCSLLGSTGTLIKTRHSFYDTKPINYSQSPSKSDTLSRSDINIVRTKDFPSIIDSGCVKRHSKLLKEGKSEEYYKNYDHDEVPVKDSSYLSSAVPSDARELTNSDLDKLETRIFTNISKELQTDESSTDTNDYNIKLFKTTVQEILDKFNSNVHDLELYKQKFQELLSKDKENIVDEMEDFIKEMIQNIVSSESCMLSEINATKLPSYGIESENTCWDESKTFTYDTEDCQIRKRQTVQAYKNENYLTDSTLDDEAAKIHYSDNKSCNIYLTKGNPCVEIKMDGRNLLSEINITNRHPEELDEIASADNIKKVAAKRLQMKNYMKQAERQSSDKIIPVKISYAKKNIHSENYVDEMEENNQSFLFRICKFLCKKLRKTSFG